MAPPFLSPLLFPLRLLFLFLPVPSARPFPFLTFFFCFRYGVPVFGRYSILFPINSLVTSTTLEAVLEAHDGTIGQTYATVTGDNIDVDGGQWLNKLGTKAGTQAISQANLHFVTGQEVFAETRVDTDGAFVKADASTKDNLKNLDRNLSVVVDANGTLKVAAMDLSNVTSITGNGLTAVRGAIEFADGDFVSVTHANDNEGKFKINLSTTGTDKTLTDDNRLVTSPKRSSPF